MSFNKLKANLTSAIFSVFKESEKVLFTLPGSDDGVYVDCIYDKNPEEYSPFETEIIETIHVFKFKYEQVPKVPTGSKITMNGIDFIVDRQADNNHRLRGHSEGDGSMVIVIGRKT